MISAKIVADSKSPTGERLTTLEIIFPRYILAEGKTHRIISGALEQVSIETSIGLNDEYYLSKNSASSRAIPFKKMVEQVAINPFIPYAWQKDHSGMQGSEYFTDELEIQTCKDIWMQGLESAIKEAKALNAHGVTKQLANRPLEAYMWHKVLISGTEWENFFNLRCPRYNINGTIFKSRKDAIAKYPMDANLTTLEWLQCNEGQADIHMMFLAEAIYDAIKESTPKELKAGEWHIPYGDNMDYEKLVECMDATKKFQPTHLDYQELMCKISIARCARLSYQTLGDNPKINYQKDLELYEVLSKSGHWSPFEHVAIAMNDDQNHYYTHTKPLYAGVYTERGWCRNFRGFIQYRVLLD